MKKAKLSVKRGRLLALALALLAVVLAVGMVATPLLLLHRKYDLAKAELVSRLEHYQRTAALGPEYEKAIDAVKARNSRRYFLKNTAVNLAGAEIQELVRAGVEGNGGKLGSIQIGQPREEGPYRAITVSVQLTANTPTLQRILLALETQTPFLFVDSMVLRTSVFRGFRPTPGVEPELRVELDVTGFLARGTN